MIPKNDNDEFYFNDEITIEKLSTVDFKMDIDNEKLGYMIDGIESLKQKIYKCINTEKGEFIIYPTFGVKKKDLFGKAKSYAYLELRRRIEEALILDDRIESVTDFKYHEKESIKNDLVMSFTVNTVYGNIRIEGSEMLNGY